MEIGKKCQSKVNVFVFIATAFLIVMSIEILLYFFFQHVKDFESSFEISRSYIKVIIQPLIELGKNIYIPYIIDQIGIVKTLFLSMSSILAMLAYFIRSLQSVHKKKSGNF